MESPYITEKRNNPWIFEPCDPEGEKNQHGIEFSHATRGSRPVNGTPTIVHGYGFTQEGADFDAQRKADNHDAYQVLHTPIWPIPV